MTSRTDRPTPSRPWDIRQQVASRLCRRPLLADTVLADTLLAALLALATVAVLLNIDRTFDASRLTMPDSPLAWSIVISPTFALPFRRLAPTAAMVVGAALTVFVWLLAYPDNMLALSVLLYSAMVHGRRERRWVAWGAACIVSAFTAAGVAAGEVPHYTLALVILQSMAFLAAGRHMASHRAYVAAAEERTRELEVAQRADRERALAEERARIARELHDVVAHGLSVMVVQAAAARRILDRDLDGTATALTQIENTGRDALSEMRQVINAIRTDPDESWRPTRGLADLASLAEELELAGLPVELDLRTEPSQSASAGRAGGELPVTVDVTAYRIVQEALTNVLKHAGPGASATVTVIRTAGELRLVIADDGQGARAPDLGGHGLRGMRERVEIFGGQLAAGPRLGGGFTVDVVLPTDGNRPQDLIDAPPRRPTAVRKNPEPSPAGGTTNSASGTSTAETPMPKRSLRGTSVTETAPTAAEATTSWSGSTPPDSNRGDPVG